MLDHDQTHYVELHCGACSRRLTLGMPAVREIAARLARHPGEQWSDVVDRMRCSACGHGRILTDTIHDTRPGWVQERDGPMPGTLATLAPGEPLAGMETLG